MIVIFWTIDGVIYEIIGPEIYENLLSKLNIPWNYDQSIKIAFICLIILFITYYLLEKFFEE